MATHQLELGRHGGPTHEAVVGVQGDGEPGTVQHPDRVIPGQPAFGVQVRGHTDLQGEAAVADVGGEGPERDDLAVTHRAVVDHLDAVADPFGATAMHRRSQARKPPCLPGVQGEVQSRLLHVADGGEMPVGGEACFGTGQVEPHHPVAGVTDREAGDVQRVVVLAHGVEDETPVHPGLRRSGGHPGQRGLDHGVGRQAPAGEEMGSEPDLGVHDAVGGEVFDRLPSHPGDRLGGLHHGDGVDERLQVALEGSRPALIEPVGEVVGIVGGKDVAYGRGQLDHGGGPEAAVEVVVEDDGGELHRPDGSPPTVKWTLGDADGEVVDEAHPQRFVRRLRPIIFVVRQRIYLVGSLLAAALVVMQPDAAPMTILGVALVGVAVGKVPWHPRYRLLAIILYDVAAGVILGIVSRSAVLAGFVVFAATGLAALVLPERQVRLATAAAGLAASVLSGYQIWFVESLRLGPDSFAVQVFIVVVSGGIVAMVAGLFGSVRRTLAKSEEEVRRLGVHQRQVLEAAPTPVLVHRMGKIGFVNAAGRRLLGAGEDTDLVGRGLLEFVHPEDRGTAIRTMGSVMAGRTVTDERLRLLTVDGDTRPVVVSSAPVTFDGEPAIQLVVSAEPSRGQELAELFERLPVALYRSTPTGEVIEANPALIELLGYPDRETLLGDRSVANDAHVDLERREEWRRRIEAEGVLVDFEQEMVRHDGTRITVSDSARVIRGDDGEVLYYEGVLVDITASKQLARSRRRLARILERTSDLVGVADPRGRVIYANVAARRFFGVPEDGELPALDALSVLGMRSEEERHAMLGALSREGRWSGELVLTRPGGGEVPVSLFVQAHYDETGRVEFYSMIARDLTSVKEAERRLEESVRARDRFVATVSHELRTPLTAIVGLVDELVEGYHRFGDDERFEMLELVAGQAHEMAAIIEDLLVAARAETRGVVLSITDVDLAAEAAAVIRALPEADRRGVAATGSAQAKGDPRRVRQIIRNLLTNALRYGGSEIAVRVGGGEQVGWVEVVDSGPGLPPEDRERIFEPYQRAGNAESKAGSVGLGLSVSRQLARLMGGDLTYRVDGGSVFRLELPAVDVAAIPTEEAGART